MISLGARAHTRHDLALAVAAALAEHDKENPAIADGGEESIVGDETGLAFYRAALDFIDDHLREQRGWRRTVLRAYRLGIRTLEPVWLGVFQRWRRNAWRDAMRQVRASGAVAAATTVIPTRERTT